MSWLTDVLERHLEIVPSAEDRAQLADLVEDSFPREEMVDAIRTSARAVLNVRKLRGEFAPGADVEAIANELARNCAAGAQGVLYLESDEVASRDSAAIIADAARRYVLTIQRAIRSAGDTDLVRAALLDDARRAGSVAIARIAAYRAEQERDAVAAELAAAKAEIAMLRGARTRQVEASA